MAWRTRWISASVMALWCPASSARMFSRECLKGVSGMIFISIATLKMRLASPETRRMVQALRFFLRPRSPAVAIQS